MWGYLKYFFCVVWFYLRRKKASFLDWLVLRRLSQNRINKRAYKISPPRQRLNSYNQKWKQFFTQEVEGMGGWVIWHDISNEKSEYVYWVPSETTSEFKTLLETMKKLNESSSKIDGVVVDPDIMAMLSNTYR